MPFLTAWCFPRFSFRAGAIVPATDTVPAGINQDNSAPGWESCWELPRLTAAV